jgi:hypothetical protein
MHTDFQKAKRKREIKSELKDFRPLVDNKNTVNKFANPKGLFWLLKTDEKTQNSFNQGQFTEVKKCSKKKLNYFVETFIAEMDPDEDVEEQFKHKHDQTFCWRFIRTLSYID